ncbi:hypothetical protein REPUB_Repub04eG0029900 [Reevesia pubescens]
MPALEEKINVPLKTVCYQESPIMSTYLLTVVVGLFEYVEDHTSDGITVPAYRPIGKVNHGKFALYVAVGTLELYKDYFAMPYSLSKLDMIAIPNFAAGAMENYGLVTYCDTALLCDEQQSAAADKQRVATVVAHELAHQWFGNLVTIEWWTHLWLNEGFATWVSYLATDSLFLEWKIWTQLLDESMEGLRLDGLPEGECLENDDDKWIKLSSSFGLGMYLRLDLGHGVAAGFQPGLGDILVFVQFESAMAAITYLHDTIVEGKKLYVSKVVKKSERTAAAEEDKPTNLYVKILVYSMTNDLLEEIFPTYRKGCSVVIMKDGKGSSRGFGFVNFQFPIDAKKALEAMNGVQMGSKNFFVGRAQKKAEMTELLNQKYKGMFNYRFEKLKASNLYVKNLAVFIDNKNLQLFDHVGQITSARVMRHENGMSKRFGFVCFSSPEEAMTALRRLNANFFEGMSLYMVVAQCKEDSCDLLQHYYVQNTLKWDFSLEENKRMRRSKEKNPGFIVPSKGQDGLRMDGVKMVEDMGQNRRKALSSINQNIAGTSFNQRCVVNKREFPGKNALCNKKSALEQRPNTRSLAVETVSNQHHFLEDTKNQTKLSLKPGSLEDCVIIDVEECDNDNDDTVPMFVKHTEAVLDETDGMMEFEMEDTTDSIIDIDNSDLKDPLALVEYVDDIYAYYRETEVSSCVSPNYMERQFDINEKMRAILIDWLIEVHYKFDLMDETLFLTINLIDRFLERCTVIRKKLQLVGMTAMLLACKYEEVFVPLVEDFVLISDKAYMRKDVLDMEKLMVNTLEFNMSVPTPYVFMRRFLKAAQSDKKLELLSFFLIELCLVEYEMLKFPPSLLAAAAIYTAQCSLCRFKNWTKTSEWHTKYSEDQLLECSKLMVTYHQRAGSGKLMGVHRKYSAYKFGHVAKNEPAQFLLHL